jgi:hypothetical protein
MYNSDYALDTCAFCGNKIRNLLGEADMMFECGGDYYRAHEDCFYDSRIDNEDDLCDDCVGGSGYIDVYFDPVEQRTWREDESWSVELFRRSRFEHYSACKKCLQPKLRGWLYEP